MKQLIRVFVLTLLLCLACTFSAGAEYIVDDAGVLEDTQILSRMADEIFQQTAIDICVESTNVFTTEEEMDTWMEQNCPQTDCAYLLIWPDGGYYWLRLVGAAQDMIDEDQYQYISDAYAYAETYQSGVVEYYRTAAECLGAEFSADLTAALSAPAAGGLITAPPGGEFTPVERTCDLVVDEAGVLTADELSRLNAMAEDIAATYPYEVAVVFLDSLNGAYVMNCADDVYDYNGFGYGANDDGILLLVCPSEREYWITACGAGMEMFSESRQEDLDYAAVDYLASDDWAGAAESFLCGCRDFLGEGMPHYTVSPIWIFIDLAVGFLLAGIPIAVLKGKMKSVAPSKEASAWMGDVELAQSRDIFIAHHQSRRHIETSSSSGGSTHRSSSGRSHSGRGGRF